MLSPVAAYLTRGFIVRDHCEGVHCEARRRKPRTVHCNSSFPVLPPALGGPLSSLHCNLAVIFLELLLFLISSFHYNLIYMPVIFSFPKGTFDP